MADFILLNMDCLEYLKQQPIQFDLILFDPPFWPYNQAYKQVREWTVHELTPIDCPTPENYQAWWNELCRASSKWLKPSGWFCYKADSWMAKLSFPVSLQYFDYSNEVIIDDEDQKNPVVLELGNVVWDKCRIGLGRRIRTKHEDIECYVSLEKGAKYWKYKMFNIKNEPHRNLNNKKVNVNVNNRKLHSDKYVDPAFPSILSIPNYGNGVLTKNKTIHINQTPPEVWYNFIDYMCPPNGTVLDLTMGTGSVGLAVQYLNKHGAARQYTGIEIDKERFNQALGFLKPQTQLTQFLKQKPLESFSTEK